MTLNEMAKEFHALAIEKGWYDGDKRTVPELLCLIHSEVSEALDEYRNGNMNTYFSGVKPDGFDIEVADIIIRILDICAYLEINIDKAIKVKHEYNKTRPYRHGNKIC